MVGAKVNGKLVPAERELQNAGGCCSHTGEGTLRFDWVVRMQNSVACCVRLASPSSSVFTAHANQHVTHFANPPPAEVVEVVHYKGPINATIIRRHQQWLDAAQVRCSEIVWLVCSWSQRMRWRGMSAQQGRASAVVNRCCQLATTAEPLAPPTHPPRCLPCLLAPTPPRCLPCLSVRRPAPRATRLPSSCGSTPRWPSPKTCRRPPAAAACRRGRGRRPQTATHGR